VRARARVCVCVCVHACAREREQESVCMCVRACAREREKERERERDVIFYLHCVALAIFAPKLVLHGMYKSKFPLEGVGMPASVLQTLQWSNRP
jgi:hypothetical protein